MANVTFSESNFTKVFKVLVGRIKTHPQTSKINLHLFEGNPNDKNPESPSQLPWLRILSASAPSEWTSPTSQKANFFLNADFAIGPLVQCNGFDMFQSISEALHGTDEPTRQKYFIQLSQAGAQTGVITLTPPTLKPVMEAIPYFYGTFQIRLEVRMNTGR